MGAAAATPSRAKAGAGSMAGEQEEQWWAQQQQQPSDQMLYPPAARLITGTSPKSSLFEAHLAAVHACAVHMCVICTCALTLPLGWTFLPGPLACLLSCTQV